MIDLRKVRQDNGLTQTALAEAAGVVRQTISNVECGINAPSVDLAKKLAEILGLNWTDFFSEDEDNE